MQHAERVLVGAVLGVDIQFEENAGIRITLKRPAAAVTLSKLPTTIHSLTALVMLSCHMGPPARVYYY